IVAKKKQPSRSPLPFIVIIILVVLGFWYYYKPAEPAQNITAPPADAGIQPGDLISIDYVLTLANGTVVDTNNAALAQEYNISNYVKGPFRFIVGQSGKIKSFDEALKGLELGQSAKKLITPSEPVLTLATNLTRRVLRNQPFPRFRELSIEKFTRAFGKKPIVGDIVVREDQPFPFKVINISNDSVRIEPSVKEKQKVRLPGFEWDSEIVIKTSNDIVIRHNPADGQVITTEFGKAIVQPEPGVLNITYQVKPGDEFTYYAPMQGGGSYPYRFSVTEVTDTAFAFARINHLPQETLVFNVTVLEWTEDVKEPKGNLIAKTKRV
ncbi:MAG: FKBP-type peptidyl-prolyl cis-trans isomerase, partial [Terriglobia bacterium]